MAFLNEVVRNPREDEIKQVKTKKVAETRSPKRALSNNIRELSRPFMMVPLGLAQMCVHDRKPGNQPDQTHESEADKKYSPSERSHHKSARKDAERRPAV